MKIKKAEITRYKIPLVKPMVTSFGSIGEREIVLIKIVDESGKIGYGEAPILTLPLYNPETPDSAISLLKNVIFPLLKNKEITTPDEVHTLLEHLKGNEFAKSAIIMAFYDLYGHITSQKVVDIIKGKKKKLLISSTISIHPQIDGALKEAKEYLDSGSTYLKLKTKPGFDVQYAKAILKKYPQVKLMIDANSSYSLSPQTIATYKQFDKLDLYCIEQPLQSFDLIDHAKLQKKIKTEIALDESIESLYDLEKAIELGSCKLVNIKIARVGGLTNALKINQLSKKNKMKTWVGGMLESPVGFYANLALATVDNFEYPIDFLGALTYIKDFEKLFNTLPYKIDGDYLYPSFEKNGLCLDINWSEMNKHKVETISL